jgi:hypothetical protein
MISEAGLARAPTGIDGIVIEGAQSLGHARAEWAFMRMKWRLALGALGVGALAGVSHPAAAKPAVNCAGAVLAGGAELLCSHVLPQAPTQLCTYSWALATSANQIKVVNGSFLLPPGSSNVDVYQASGYARASSEPIVMCQGKRAR